MGRILLAIVVSFPWQHTKKPDLAHQVAAWNQEIAWQHAGWCEAYLQADGDIDFFFFGTDNQVGAAIYDSSAQREKRNNLGTSGCHDASQNWKYVDSRTVIRFNLL